MRTTPFSVSEALSFQACEERHRLEYVEKRIPRGTHARALTVGVAAHAAFQTALLNPDEQCLRGSFGERYSPSEEGGFEAHISILITESLSQRGITPSPEDLDEARAAGRGLRAAFKEVRNRNLKVLAVEETFETTIAGRKWRGRWDAIVEDAEGGIWHMQLKTSSRPEQMVGAVSRSFHEALYQKGGREKYGAAYRGTLLLIAVKEPAHRKEKGAPACPCCGKAGLVRRAERAEVRPIRITDAHEADRIKDLTTLAFRISEAQDAFRVKSEHTCANHYGRECWFTEVCWGGQSIHDDLMFEDSDPFAGYAASETEGVS